MQAPAREVELFAACLAWWRGWCASRRRLAEAVRTCSAVRVVAETRVPFAVDAHRMRRSLRAARSRARATTKARECVRRVETQVAALERRAYFRAVQGSLEELRSTLVGNTVDDVVNKAGEAGSPSGQGVRHTEFSFGVGSPLWFPENAREHLQFDVALSKQEVKDGVRAVCEATDEAMASLKGILRDGGFELTDHTVRVSTKGTSRTGFACTGTKQRARSVDAVLAQRVELSTNTYFHCSVSWRCSSRKEIQSHQQQQQQQLREIDCARDEACRAWFGMVAARLRQLARRARRRTRAEEWDLISV